MMNRASENNLVFIQDLIEDRRILIGLCGI